MSSKTETVQVPRYSGLDQWTLMNWLRNHSALTGSAYTVAWVLASFYYREDTGYAYPGAERLARDAHTTVRSVYRAVDAMMAAGEWVVIQGSGGRKNLKRSEKDDHRTNLYYPVIPHHRPEGVRKVGVKTITVEERTPRQPLVPVHLYDADDPADYVAEADMVTGDHDDHVPTGRVIDAAPAISTEVTSRQPDAQRVAQQSSVVSRQPVLASSTDAWVASALGARWREYERTSPAKRAEIERAAAEVVAGGHDLSAVLSAALHVTQDNGQEIGSVSGWVLSALSRPDYWLTRVDARASAGMNANMGSGAETQAWLMHGITEDTDYGHTGQEF